MTDVGIGDDRVILESSNQSEYVILSSKIVTEPETSDKSRSQSGCLTAVSYQHGFDRSEEHSTDALHAEVSPAVPTACTALFPPRNDGPQSYYSHTVKEELMLEFLDRFLTQFQRFYPDRKAQFILPHNDCGIAKMVCTFLRPTLVPYEECCHFAGCSKFVCDHLELRPLEDPTQIPSLMRAPTEVLRYQSANVFEFSTLLCSFLLGAGYNAYVVSGYAVRSICIRDTCRVEYFPSDEEARDDQPVPDVTSGENEENEPYVSKYEQMMKNREELVLAKLKQEKEDEEMRKRAELEKEDVDPLEGRRVHSWVLILPGKRDIEHPFFIEPTRGETRDLTSSDYLSIESLWNHRNYWINMQDRSVGMDNLQYDLYNPKHWEYFLLSDALQTPHPHQTKASFEEDIKDAYELLEMPFSWVDRIEIPRSRYQYRFPCGRKCVKYYRTKLDLFAPYCMKNGIVKRITSYGDFACTKPLKVEELFAHRNDCLISKFLDVISARVTECFCYGRKDKLFKHQYNLNNDRASAFRMMQYHHAARNNGLSVRRVDGAGLVLEEYVDRPDGITHREMSFELVTDCENCLTERKYVKKIVEHLRVVDQEEGVKNVRMRVFNISDGSMSVEFDPATDHSEVERRHFAKAQLEDHDGLVSMLEKAAHSNCDATYPPPKPAKLKDMFTMYTSLLSLEQTAIAEALETQTEIANLVKGRHAEEENVDVVYDLFDSDLSPSVRRDRKAMEEKQAAEARRLLEESKDPLSSLLRKAGKPSEELSSDEKRELCEECVSNFRRKLAEKGERILSKLREAAEDLESHKSKYNESHQSLSSQEENEYMEYCRATSHRMQMLEQLLESHRLLSPIRIEALQKQLANDPRMQDVPPKSSHSQH